jgi:tetratricopeptide (TPR) repeat protein
MQLKNKCIIPIRSTVFVSLIGTIIGFGIYGCKKEEPVSKDTAPRETELQQVEEIPSLLETSVDYYNRGKAYVDKGQYDLAISDYNKAIEIKAIEIDPGYSEAYCNRGFAYAGKGEYDQAISDLNRAIELESKAIEIDPMYAEGYCNGLLTLVKANTTRLSRT